MKMSVETFGTLPDGRKADLYIMENNRGTQVRITNYAGAITHLFVPDRNGDLGDVVLGHRDMEGYLGNPEHFGAAIGRNSNRIAGASVTIGGTEYQLEANDGPNSLHSGSKGMHHRLFDAEFRTVSGFPTLVLSTTIPDGEDGFPGNLEVTIAYALTEDNALMLDYHAVCDRDTVINLTNHSYFNLAGHASGHIYDHKMRANAPFYTPNGEDCIPTGEILSVAGTAFDFLEAKPMGRDIAGEDPQIQMFGGYDHNLVLAGEGYRRAITVEEPVSGRTMEVFTDMPGVQFYTGNGLPVTDCAKDGASYGRHQGFCLETQTFPGATAMPWLRSPIYPAGEEYTACTTYRFDVVGER